MTAGDLECVNKIQIELDQFTDSLLSKGSWDIIVPVMRKGLFLLAKSPEGQRAKIRLPPFYGVNAVETKAILIVDDKAWHGHTMNKKFSEVLSTGAKKENIRTAVFMKHDSCEFPIDFFHYEFGDEEYTEKEADLSVYYDSLCLQIDPDHLVVKGTVSVESLDARELTQFPSEVEKTTSDLGIFYFQESSSLLWGRMKFAIVDIDLSKLGLKDLDSVFQTEGVQKVRFCLEPNGGLFIVPIFYPEIHTDRNSCQKIGVISSELCKELNQEIPRSLGLCRECIDFNLQISAFKAFFNLLSDRIRRSGFAINIIDLSWPELEFKYPEVTKILARSLRTINE
jgi:hypothetical protein